MTTKRKQNYTSIHLDRYIERNANATIVDGMFVAGVLLYTTNAKSVTIFYNYDQSRHPLKFIEEQFWSMPISKGLELYYGTLDDDPSYVASVEIRLKGESHADKPNYHPKWNSHVFDSLMDNFVNADRCRYNDIMNLLINSDTIEGIYALEKAHS